MNFKQSIDVINIPLKKKELSILISWWH